MATAGTFIHASHRSSPKQATPMSALPNSATPNYPARRMVVAIGVVLAVAASLVLAEAVLSTFESQPALAVDDDPVDARAGQSHYVAQSGDSVWSIAGRFRGAVSHERYVDALIRLNGGSTIYAGQAVLLP